jgi:prepilin-type N-terminal cleavage/methylation domain-containing protein
MSKELRVKSYEVRKDRTNKVGGPPTSYLLPPTSARRGFTLVELLVSVAIFVFMTALLVAKYGTFNQSVLLTDLAYDVALTVRTAQTYGLSVTSATNSSVDAFKYAYGVDLTTLAPSPAGNSDNQLILFADTNTIPSNPNSIYDGDVQVTPGADKVINTYAIKRGAIVSGFCTTESGCATLLTGQLDITFKRPNPNAKICLGSDCSPAYVQITLRGTDGSTRTVVVRSNGQISVGD